MLARSRGLYHVVLSVCCAAYQASGTIVEFSIDKAPLPGLTVGTCGSDPTATEKPFFDRLSEADQITIESKPDAKGEKSEFKLIGHKDQFVSWFGIVRDIKRNADGASATLLVQNTYYDGQTDCHIQTVEINGAGDFDVEMDAVPEDLIPLVLVRVYGVVIAEQNNRPVIKSDYMRVWHWFQFNFMDFGEDHTNPEWRKRMNLPPDEDIYHMGVSPKYYDERLGPTKEEWEQIKAFHRGQTELEFERLGIDHFDKSGVNYKPTEWEQRYFDRLKKEDRIMVQSKGREGGHPTFCLTGHLHQYVSWFGIVRDITRTLGKRGGTVLIENKYFQGKGDERLQTVSIRGGGNFKAEMTNLTEELEPLVLVRVYGTVLREEEGVPVVEATFVRGWQWTQFNFDDYGEDHGDGHWTKNLQLKRGDPVHAKKVSANYYINRLSPTPEQAERITNFLKAEEDREKDERQRKKTSEGGKP